MPASPRSPDPDPEPGGGPLIHAPHSAAERRRVAVRVALGVAYVAALVVGTLWVLEWLLGI